MLGLDCGGRKRIQDTRTPVSSLLCCSSAVASTAGCGHGGAAANSGPVETLYCRSRTQNDSWPSRLLVTRLLLQHPDLQKPGQEKD